MSITSACAYLLIRGTEEGPVPARRSTLLFAHRVGVGTSPVAATASVDGSSFGDVNVDKAIGSRPLCIIYQNET